VPAAALALAINQRILCHHVTVVAQHGFCQADEWIADDQISEGIVVFEHAHETDAANVVAFGICKNSRILRLADNGLSKHFDFILM
jgi:hypothetical protein